MPTQCIGKNRAAVIRAVPAVPENETEVISGAGQRGGDLEILCEPVAL